MLIRRLNSSLRLLFLVALAAPLAAHLALAQSTPAPPQPQPDQSAPDSGGPAGDNGPIALPKIKDKPADAPPAAPAPAEPKVKPPEGLTNIPALRITVPEVTVDVGVILEKTHQFVPNLKPVNFKVYEDGIEQKIVGFKRVEAPITVLLLCEFASTNYNFIYDMRNAAFAFAQQLRPQDYVAMMTFDMRTQKIGRAHV